MRKSYACVSTSFLLVGLVLACGGDSVGSPGTAILEITTTTSGVEPDADGYLVQVDAGGPEAIETGGTYRIPDLAAGSHTILLARFAPDCTVAGDNPRTIDVPGGLTVAASFAVTCAPTTVSAFAPRSKNLPSRSSRRTIRIVPWRASCDLAAFWGQLAGF